MTARTSGKKTRTRPKPRPKTSRPARPAKKEASASAGELDRRWRTSPFVLRVTRWSGYPEPVLIVSERHVEEDAKTKAPPKLLARGVIWGDSLRRCLPVLKRVLATVADETGVPLDLPRFLGKDGLGFRGNLPIDEEAGAKLALLFKLQERIKDIDRAELIALRTEKFTREEAFYWLSRMTHFGPVANAWAVTGMRTLLAGEAGDPGIIPTLEKLRLRH